MAKITYNDKTYLNQNPSIADENKVNDTDMNELKYGTNDILDLLGLSTDDYSTSTSYLVGDRVIYNNQVYECNTNTSGTFNEANWDLIPTFISVDGLLRINPEVLCTNLVSGGNAVRTNRKIDGKWVYTKRIIFGDLPNASTKNVATGINLNNYAIDRIDGYCKSKTNNVGFAIPFANPGNLSYSIMVNMTNNNEISVTTGIDRRSYEAWFDIYFY